MFCMRIYPHSPAKPAVKSSTRVVSGYDAAESIVGGIGDSISGRIARSANRIEPVEQTARPDRESCSAQRQPGESVARGPSRHGLEAIGQCWSIPHKKTEETGAYDYA